MSRRRFGNKKTRTKKSFFLYLLLCVLVLGVGFANIETLLNIGGSLEVARYNPAYTIQYALNGGEVGSGTPTSAKNTTVIEISKPTKTFTVNIDANSQGATITSGGENVTSASSVQTFAGWTATNLDTTNAKYGTTNSTVSTAWSNGSTLIGANDNSLFFKGLGEPASQITLTANWTPTAVTLPKLEKTDYVCQYNTEPNGDGSSYASEDSYIPNAVEASVTLYVTCFLTATDYSYTGNIQTYTVPSTGNYLLEVWGAQGGSVTDFVGGYGGYSRGTVSLTKGTVLYIGVGGAGTGATAEGQSLSGGYNGGGQVVGNSGVNHITASGGGATHIVTTTNRGVLSNYSSNQSEVLIVAGGGGGARDQVNHETAARWGNGGSGGG